MNLRQKRVLFSTLMAEHIVAINRDHILGLGVEVAQGEGMDRKTAKDPTSDHMRSSLHNIGLAQDLDMYINGVYQMDSRAHELSGQIWESRHPLCRNGRKWGDGNHYSLEHEGIK